MRTPEEIKAEITRVEKAEMTAVKKQARCLRRLNELREELKTSEEQIPGYSTRDKMTGEKVRAPYGIF